MLRRRTWKNVYVTLNQLKKIKDVQDDKDMASYKEIKNFIQEKHGTKVKSGWIAHGKGVFGVAVKRAPNRKSDVRLWPCPKKNLPLIKEAFEHFEMI